MPRLGPKGAQRIVDWLQLHAHALQHALSPLALLPRRQWGPDHAALAHHLRVSEDEALVMAPLEALRVPAVLDGSRGSNRAGANSRFDTDVRAIFAWLDARSASEHTRRAYRREAERLLLWALLEKGKPLSSLDGQEGAEYIGTFLPDPQPASCWVSARRGEWHASGWRLFGCPLSDRSRESARSILSAMCEWLVREAYLATNPFAGVARGVSARLRRNRAHARPSAVANPASVGHVRDVHVFRASRPAGAAPGLRHRLAPGRTGRRAADRRAERRSAARRGWRGLAAHGRLGP
ncbi:phage integrase family protein [Candidatus Paraburkholderia kirkii]|nr:phage integrase family protein [Candidatus Paraburkholderia kirkii]